MKSKNVVFRDTSVVAIGQLITTATMIGIFALLGKFDTSLLLGGIAGAAVATVNFFFMALFANLAANKAAAQDVSGGQKLILLSYLGRMLGLFAVLAICARSGLFNVLALVIPLAFTRPILTFAEIFKKKGDETA